MVTFGGLSRSPKVTTVLQRRALAMHPRYILVVSYQISSNMVASATAPLRWRACSCARLFRFLRFDHFEVALVFGCFFNLKSDPPPLSVCVSSTSQALPPPPSAHSKLPITFETCRSSSAASGTTALQERYYR